MRTHQLHLFPRPRLDHGGSVTTGRRKIARPIDPKRALHVVLRSSRARGAWSLLHPKHKGRVHFLVESVSERFGVRVYRFSNVGNHIHLLVKARDRAGFQSFLRVLAGTIAFSVTGAKKGNPVGRFWDSLAYSRIIQWGKEFERVSIYLVKNLLEGLNALDRKRQDRDIKLLDVDELKFYLRP